MRNLKIFFGILFTAVLVTSIGCSDDQQQKIVNTVSLKFKNPNIGFGRESDSIILVDVIVESTSPLRVVSNKVQVVSGNDENETFAEGLVLINMTGREVTRSGYIFNNASQCWVWGRWITNTVTGQTDFQFGTASEQAYHNICAPRGSYYAKLKR